MTPFEYRDYVRRFEASREWVARFDPLDPDADPSFSWSRCDICERPAGGLRTECCWVPSADPSSLAAWTLIGGDTIAVCNDCLYYQEYGRLDDDRLSGDVEHFGGR